MEATATLFSYQKAEIIYDGTVYFTNRFFTNMTALWGKWCRLSAVVSKTQQQQAWLATSKETEIKLTNVARASLEELQIDYEDFLRTNKLPYWDKEHKLVARLRELNKSTPKPTYETFAKAIEHQNPEICANAMIT